MRHACHTWFTHVYFEKKKWKKCIQTRRLFRSCSSAHLPLLATSSSVRGDSFSREACRVLFTTDLQFSFLSSYTEGLYHDVCACMSIHGGVPILYIYTEWKRIRVFILEDSEIQILFVIRGRYISGLSVWTTGFDLVQVSIIPCRALYLTGRYLQKFSYHPRRSRFSVPLMGRKIMYFSNHVSTCSSLSASLFHYPTIVAFIRIHDFFFPLPLLKTNLLRMHTSRARVRKRHFGHKSDNQ